MSFQIKIHQHICLELFQTCKRCLICADFSPNSDEITFSLGQATLWIEDDGLKLKTSWWVCFLQTCSFSRHKTLTDGLECGLLVDYYWCFYQLFGLSFWRHPFTAEDPLVSKWCNATFLQIWWRNKLIWILNGQRVRTFSENFHFWVNYYFNTALYCIKCFKTNVT